MPVIVQTGIDDYLFADRRRHPALYREAPSSSQSSLPRLDLLFLQQLSETADVSNYQRMEQQYNALCDSLASMGRLTHGWDSYGAPSPNREALTHGRAALITLRALQAAPVAVRPSGDGGVAILFRLNDRRAEIEFTNEGEGYATTYGLNDAAQSWQFEIGSEGQGLTEAWSRIRGFLQSR